MPVKTRGTKSNPKEKTANCKKKKVTVIAGETGEIGVKTRGTKSNPKEKTANGKKKKETVIAAKTVGNTNNRPVQITNSNKKLKKSKKNPPQVEHCYKECELDRCFHPNMIQCCTCMKLIHNQCAKLEENHLSPIWNCHYCRRIHEKLDSLTSYVEEMKIQLTKLCDLNGNLLQQLSQKTEDFEKLLQENTVMKQQLLVAESNVVQKEELAANLRTGAGSNPGEESTSVTHQPLEASLLHQPTHQPAPAAMSLPLYQSAPHQVSAPMSLPLYHPTSHQVSTSFGLPLPQQAFQPVLAPVPQVTKPRYQPLMQPRIQKDTYAAAVRRNRGTLASQQHPQSRVFRNVHVGVPYVHSGYNNTKKISYSNNYLKTCHKCQIPGHIARDCTTIQCYKCGGWGHKSIHCVQ